jgi:RNA polymerase sigma-70 factor (family 1)
MMVQTKIIDISDEGLLQSIQNGDQKSFEEIFRRYWSKLYTYAYNVLKDNEICEDIVQEIFVDLWSRRNEVTILNLSAYLYKSVKFKIYKQFRQKQYKNQFAEHFEQFHDQMNPADHQEYKDLMSKVDGLVAQMPEKRKIIFQLSRYEELSNREIAEKLKISIQTVKNEISKSLKFIRESMKNIYFLIF